MNANITNDNAPGSEIARGPEPAPGPGTPSGTGETPAPAGPRRVVVPAREAVSLVVVAAALGWAYWPNFLYLYRIWVREPDYTHGFLVLPIALAILWRRWPGPDDPRPAPWLPGWLLVVAALVARVVFLERGQNWLEAATLLPVVVGLGLARLGWRTMLRVWPAFAFLVFLYPLPPQINSALSQPLQSLATTCACALLKLTGLWVMAEGNVILVGNERLEVAAACNGLSMLMSLAATVAAAASLVPMSNLKRGVLLVSIIPIALASNILRIAATAWCYYAFGADVGSKYAHDLAGWLMMPTAMALVALELAIVSWLVIESDEEERPSDRFALGLATAPRQPKGLP
jgi:exosortase